jgi:hypothetical protein
MAGSGSGSVARTRKPLAIHATIRIARGGIVRPRSEFFRLVQTLLAWPCNDSTGAPVSHAYSFCLVETTHWFRVTIDSAAQASLFLFNSTFAGVFACSKRSNTLNGRPSGHFAMRDQQSSSGRSDHFCHVNPAYPAPTTATTTKQRKRPRRQFRCIRIARPCRSLGII